MIVGGTGRHRVWGGAAAEAAVSAVRRLSRGVSERQGGREGGVSVFSSASASLCLCLCVREEQ